MKSLTKASRPSAMARSADGPSLESAWYGFIWLFTLVVIGRGAFGLSALVPLFAMAFIIERLYSSPDRQARRWAGQGEALVPLMDGAKWPEIIDKMANACQLDAKAPLERIVPVILARLERWDLDGAARDLAGLSNPSMPPSRFTWEHGGLTGQALRSIVAWLRPKPFAGQDLLTARELSVDGIVISIASDDEFSFRRHATHLALMEFMGMLEAIARGDATALNEGHRRFCSSYLAGTHPGLRRLVTAIARLEVDGLADAVEDRFGVDARALGEAMRQGEARQVASPYRASLPTRAQSPVATGAVASLQPWVEIGMRRLGSARTLGASRVCAAFACIGMAAALHGLLSELAVVWSGFSSALVPAIVAMFGASVLDRELQTRHQLRVLGRHPVAIDPVWRAELRHALERPCDPADGGRELIEAKDMASVLTCATTELALSGGDLDSARTGLEELFFAHAHEGVVEGRCAPAVLASLMRAAALSGHPDKAFEIHARARRAWPASWFGLRSGRGWQRRGVSSRGSHPAALALALAVAHAKREDWAEVANQLRLAAKQGSRELVLEPYEASLYRALARALSVRGFEDGPDLGLRGSSAGGIIDEAWLAELWPELTTMAALASGRPEGDEVARGGCVSSV